MIFYRNCGQTPIVSFCIIVYLCNRIAIVAQLVERWLPKPKVASSKLVYRS